MTYPEWVRLLLRMHRSARGHGQRCTGCWACDVLDLPETDRMRCADLSRGAPGTVGGFDGHHLLPKQVLKRELGRRLPFEVVVSQLSPAEIIAAGPAATELVVETRVYRTLDDVLFDERIGVPLRRWHHDQWENRRLSVPRWMLPAGVEEIAVEFGLDWWLDRTFGEVVQRVR